MRKFVDVAIALLSCALSGTIHANLIPANHDFSNVLTGWSSWVDGSGQAEPGVAWIGWTDNKVVWQRTGHLIQSDSIYTLTARVRSQDDSGGQVEGATLILQHGDNGSWPDILRKTFWFPSEDNGVKSGPWREFSISFNSADYPGIVGHEILVAIAVADDGRWDNYGNLYIDNMELVKSSNRNITLNPSSLTVTENVNPVGSYNIQLSWDSGHAPNADVQITVTSGTNGQYISLNGAPAGQAVTLTFTSAQGYDTPQTVTVTAIDDSQKLGRHMVSVMHAVSSTDSNWDSWPVSTVKVQIIDDEMLTNTAALERWRSQRFGMFIHWGPVAQTGGEISWSRNSYGAAAYDRLYTTFNPVNFDAHQWVALAQAAGMKYLVLTTKHHDGFCLYDSAYTTYDMMSTPFNRDVTQELADECVAQGIEFCAYYSIPDWKYTDNPLSNYVPYQRSQVTEIIYKYNPSIMWFDNWENAVSGWDISGGWDLYNLCRNAKDPMLVNDRVYAAYLPTDSQYPGDYKTPEQKVGAFNDQFPWESCITIANQWAWKPNDPVKSLKQCIQTLVSCAGGDGNLLLNIGPKGDGSIEPQQVCRLQEIGQWLNSNNNSKAIYNTRGGPVAPQSWGVMTHQGNKLYAHIWGQNWLASHGTAVQSTTYSSNYPASKAVDSDTATFNHTAAETTPTWQIKTDAKYHFTKIELISRIGFEDRATDYVVEIMDFTGNVTSQFALGSGGSVRYRTEILNPGNAMNNPTMITVDLTARTGGPVTGNLIRVARNGDYLHLAEVQAYATNQPGTGQQITIPGMGGHLVQNAYLLANPAASVPFTQVGQNVTLNMISVPGDPIDTIVAMDVVSVTEFVTLTEPASRAVFQRNADNMADVPVEGTCSGSFTRIEARAVIMNGFTGTATDWEMIDAAPSGGRFSGALPVASGGWYSIEARGYNGSTYSGVTCVDRIGVGEVFITAGQSNSANYGSPAMTPTQDIVSAWTGSQNVWRHACDPQPNADGTGGAPWSRLGDILVQRFGCPVGFMSNGVGSTRVDQWLPGSEYYQKIVSSIRATGPNGFRAILWHQGESDSLASTSASTYAGRLNSIIAQTRVDAGWDVPWGVALASYHPSSSAAQEIQVRSGQLQVIKEDPLVFEGADTDGFLAMGYLHDGVHFNAAGLNEHALDWKRAILKYLFPCDFEPDSDIDFSDTVFFASHWLSSNCIDSATCDEADLLEDNAVNLGDFSICAEQWLK